MVQLTIQVKDKHIKNGIKKDICRCPIALAIKERIKDPRIGVYVGAGTIRLAARDYSEKLWFLYDKIGDKIIQFDSQGTMKPFSFELDVDEDTIVKYGIRID